MPSIKKVGEHVQLEVERLDGGLNTKDAPSRIELTESPECLNVVFDDRGAVQTREGTTYYSTSISETTDTTAITHNIEIGENPIDGLARYNNTMVVWAGGDMLRASGTTFVTVPSSVGQFSSGVQVAYQQFQDILFCSDGTNGPWRYEGGSDFYNMGIDTPASECTGASDTSGGGDVAADTYYYAVTFVNSHAVEGGIGLISDGTTLGASASIDVSCVPVGTGIQGVAERNIYRATSTSGPWLFVKNLADNVSSSFSDNIAVGSEGGNPPDDATAPTPFSCIKLHHERLWFPDSSNETLLRYTEYNNPFVSKALSFRPLSRGDGSDIAAIGIQDDLVCSFKGNSIWLTAIGDASDDTTFQYVKSPANMGIVGARALYEGPNGIIFVGKRDNMITGVHLLSGISVVETSNRELRTESISEKIEADVFTWPSSLWSKIAMGSFKNRLYIGAANSSNSSLIDALYYFDMTRLGIGGQPGSWVKWNGVVGCTDFVVLDDTLYGAWSNDGWGNILSFNNGTYTDASGAAIDSYYWTKQMGGEQSIDSWIKDWRFVNVWYSKLGQYDMTMTYRVDGGGGSTEDIDLDPETTVWASSVSDPSAVSLVWADSGDGDTSDEVWASDENDDESQHSVGPLVGRRIQIKFDNQNTAGQGFQIYSLKTLMNLRRQR